MVYTELVQYITARDTPAKFESDKAFLEHLEQRLAKSDRPRFWMSKADIKRLRTLGGMNTSEKNLRNRRMRRATIQGHVNLAYEKLAVRAGELVQQRLAPRKMPDLSESTKRAWSSALGAPYGGVIKTNLP